MEIIVKGLAFLLKPLLFPLSLIYGLVIWIRNKVYDKGIYDSIEFSLPVISVGNLSTGGTGKTPQIEYLIRLLQYEYRVATMSRGYKRLTKGFRLAGPHDNAETLGDEPMQFYSKFSDLYVTVAADRMAGIPELINLRPDTEVILLDDAFQHRSVKPGLSILMMDYTKPFYKDYILPFGRLREARSGYKRAQIIVVSKCPETINQTEMEEVIKHLNPTPEQKVYFSKIAYAPLVDFFSGQEISLVAEKQHFVIVSGIAKPEPMIHYLESWKAQTHLLRFPDHHYFGDADLEEIQSTLKNWEVPNKALVISEKDAMRLAFHKEKLQNLGVPVYVLPIYTQFITGREAFDEQVTTYVRESLDADLFEE